MTGEPLGFVGCVNWEDGFVTWSSFCLSFAFSEKTDDLLINMYGSDEDLFSLSPRGINFWEYV